MKPILFVLALAVPALAQQKATMVLPQCAQVGMVPVTTSITIGGTSFPLLVCAVLDPATFRLDMSIKPPTLRVVVAANGPVSVDGVDLLGTADGVNAIFTLPDVPNPASSLHLHRNGQRLRAGADFALLGNTVTFVAAAIPQGGDSLQADYKK